MYFVLLMLKPLRNGQLISYRVFFYPSLIYTSIQYAHRKEEPLRGADEEEGEEAAAENTPLLQ